MHYGRYGRDASDYRQQPLFLGYPFWVRGYESGSFNSNECRGTGILRDPLTGAPADRGQSACPVFDRLIGSRIALASAEFRIPLFGTEQFGLINFPFFPTEIAPFVDVGAAWTPSQPVKFRFDTNPLNEERVPVFSAGISARVNVLGYLVVEAYYVKPFQRPGVGSHFGFQIQPGW
jgi:outer membrane protein assembly factor BamA